mgnify:CR=1 FL=1
MKKLIALLMALCLVMGMVACGAEKPQDKEMSETQKIILEAQNMTLEELAKKAIEESNGAMFYGLGNSSRGKTALPLFIAYLQTIDPNYKMDFEWQQPKNNKIFDQLTADSLKETGTFAMTLIQDGNQIQSKMVNTGILDTFIPKDWADANGTTADAYKGFLPLQTLNKVFMFNNTDGYYVTRGNFHEEFEDTAFSLEIGEVSGIIKTDAGLSIIKRYEKDAAYIEKNADSLASDYIEGLYNIALDKYSSTLVIEDTPKASKYSIFNLK